ncbi:AI-2E family transporter [Pseudomonas luteola]
MQFADIEKRAGATIALVVLAASVYLITPFAISMFWAALMVLSTWPVMKWLNRQWNKPLLNASILTSLWVILVLGPLAAMIAILAVEAKSFYELFAQYSTAPLPDLPSWAIQMPFAGSYIQHWWSDLQAAGAQWTGALKPVLEKGLGVLVTKGSHVLHVILDIALMLCFVLLFYWQGQEISALGHKALNRLVGEGSRRYIQIVTSTLSNVINGIVGTALIQAVLAMVGFFIAGVPGALLLGVAIFFLSLIPMGPPLVWGPAAAWLFYQGRVGMAIFIVVWCIIVLAVLVDHVLKPILISRGSVMPLALVLIGIFGGILNFGFVGVFVGPAILALGYSLVMVWLEAKEKEEETPGHFQAQPELENPL